MIPKSRDRSDSVQRAKIRGRDTTGKVVMESCVDSISPALSILGE